MRGLPIYLAFLLVFLAVGFIYHAAVPPAKRGRLAEWWKGIEPRISPYLSMLWVAICVIAVPLLAIIYIGRGK